MNRRLFVCALTLTIAACAPARVAVNPTIAARATLAQADSDLRAGCFDCLAAALKRYESVRRVAAVSRLATAGAVRAAALLALRERELGTTDSGYLEHARELLAAVPELQADVAPLLEIIDVIPWRAGAGRSGSPDSSLNIFRNRKQRVEALKSRAGRDALSAYVWIAYACESGAGLQLGTDGISAPVAGFADQPLIAYRLAICPTSGPGLLDDVVVAEPRYKEAAYYRGLNATSARKLDDAEAQYRDAFAWRETWPAATLAIANVAMTGEDFTGALDFYDRTLALAPLLPDALLGKLRAVSYLGRHQDALDTADQLLAIQRYPGDAHYWRAYNELNMSRLDAAWDDIDAADRSLINSEVPKLAGIIEINRRHYDVAREKLELSQQRNPADCQTGYFLHLVLTEQRTWDRAVVVGEGAALCLELEIKLTQAEIESIRASNIAETRKERQIAGREQRISADGRMRASCWFNSAVSSYDLNRKELAKELAGKVADDEQFGDRARQLLALIKP